MLLLASSVCPLMDEVESYVSFLMVETGDEKNCLALVGRALPSKALIQFSADEWGCPPPSPFVVGPKAAQPW